MNKFVKVATGAAISAALVIGSAAGAQAGIKGYPNGNGSNQGPTISLPKPVIKGHKVVIKGTIKANGTAAGATVKIIFKNKAGNVVKTVTVKTTKGGKYATPKVNLPKNGKYVVSTKVLDKGKYGSTKTKSTVIKVKGKK